MAVKKWGLYRLCHGYSMKQIHCQRGRSNGETPVWNLLLLLLLLLLASVGVHLATRARVAPVEALGCTAAVKIVKGMPVERSHLAKRRMRELLLLLLLLWGWIDK